METPKIIKSDITRHHIA